MRRCWVWQVIPEHADETIRDLCAETAVQRKALKHLNSLLEEKVLVVQRLTGRECRNGIEGELGILNTETSYVADDASLLVILQPT
jgi:hypothetical protein